LIAQKKMEQRAFAAIPEEMTQSPSRIIFTAFIAEMNFGFCRLSGRYPLK